jgi:hypothetical protein
MPLPTTTSGELRKLRVLMRPKHSLDRLPTVRASGLHDSMVMLFATGGEMHLALAPTTGLDVTRPSSIRHSKSWMGATHFQMKTLERVSTKMALHVLAHDM